jgi:prepilin-type N-terminal cleavage/methylation domain-containing protein
MLRNNKGFTLIELLIVIVIIGILAVAVLSAINPIEQINKAKDQGQKSDAAELLNSLERYYTTFQEYPWDKMTGASGPVSGTPVMAGTSGTAQTWIGVAVGDSDIASLVGTSELKPEFARRKSLNDLKVFLYAPSTGSTNYLVRVCFLPTSKNFKLLANYTTDGVYSTTAGATGQLICVPE